ncbi:MAG: helicase HerA-like domain-containing protein, partial [Usitatibacteraceae bacterium]
KAVKAAAETFRANPAISVETVITELGVGEALVSFLDEKGRPTIVERAFVCPPQSQIGPITPEQRSTLLQTSLVAGVYEKVVDRESAFEKLRGRQGDATSTSTSAAGGLSDILGKVGLPGMGGGNGGGSGSGSRSNREGVVEAAMKSAARAMASEAGRKIIRGVLGSILGGRR